MEILQPDTWDEALALKAAHPEARPIAGRDRPDGRAELRPHPPAADPRPQRGSRRCASGTRHGDGLRIGAGRDLHAADRRARRPPAGPGDRLRTVGSPQIRNRGTVGGNLGTASPAGDGLPPLFAADAVVEVASVRGARRIPVAEFVTGPKRNAMADDELIAAFHVAAGRRARSSSRRSARATRW